jgi:hypothetical protein
VAKSLLVHLPGPASLRKFTIEQGCLAYEVPGIPPNRSLQNDIFSRTRDNLACGTDTSAPL